MNVCLDFSPAYGGVVKAVEDFQEALGGRILSFDGDREERVTSEKVIYIDETSQFIGKEHLFMRKDSMRRAKQRIISEESNLIVAHSLFRGHCQWARKTAYELGASYWAVPHGSLDPWVFTYGQSFKRFWMAASGQQYLKDASAVIFATERERIKAQHIYDGPNVQVVHWPVALLDLDKKNSSRKWLHSRLQISDDERIILYLGRYDDMKRPLETIQAFSRAKAADCHLVLVGNDFGLNSQDLLNEAEGLDAQDRIHVVGPLFGEDKNKALLGADAFVSLSHRENFGYTTAEALSSSLPVILSPGNDLAYELINANCGWCLQSMGIDEAVSAIEAFAAATEGDLDLMGQRGRDWCEKHLRQELFATSLRSLASIC